MLRDGSVDFLHMQLGNVLHSIDCPLLVATSAPDHNNAAVDLVHVKPHGNSGGLTPHVGIKSH
jgi:hypothetical protein